MLSATTAGTQTPKNTHIIINAVRQQKGKLAPEKEPPKKETLSQAPDLFDEFSCFA